MKSYRSRNLTQRCQIAKSEDGINPLRDEKGNLILDHGGLFFLKVSGGENHDRKRLIPQDHQAFFKQKVKEVEEALRAEGVTDASVSVEDVYSEFVSLFTKPSGTYAPVGHPEEFSLVIPKQLCVNWSGGIGVGGPSIRAVPTVAPQAMSIFARIKAAREQANSQPNPSTNRKPKAAG